MAYWDVRRSIVSAQLLIRLAQTHGMAAEDCLRGSGLVPAQLLDPATEITAAEELALVRNLVARLGAVPGIGLDAGLSYHLSAYGIWGFALVSSPTFGDAAQLALRYLDLSYAFVRYYLHGSGHEVCWGIDDAGIEPGLRRFLVERDIAAFVNAVREIVPGGFSFRRAQLAFPRPTYAERFTALLGVAPQFDAPMHAVWLDARDLAAPLPQANPDMARLCEQQCRELLARRQVRGGLAGRVRDRLLRAPGQIPDIETVAAELRLSPRSLRRHLDAEATSFRALVEEVREALAVELLTGANMKLDEVAQRLGYAEPASFIRAFQRWKGQTPAAYRRSWQRPAG